MLPGPAVMFALGLYDVTMEWKPCQQWCWGCIHLPLKIGITLLGQDLTLQALWHCVSLKVFLFGLLPRQQEVLDMLHVNWD